MSGLDIVLTIALLVCLAHIAWFWRYRPRPISGPGDEVHIDGKRYTLTAIQFDPNDANRAEFTETDYYRAQRRVFP